MDAELLATWHKALVAGERLHLHRAEQRLLVEEVIRLQADAANFDKVLKEREQLYNMRERAWMTQMRDVQRTMVIQTGRGLRTNLHGIHVDPDTHDSPLQHGVVLNWPDKLDPHLCDWGKAGGLCEQVAVVLRWDSTLEAWFAACERCSETQG